jgi:hypothetical protein
MRHTATFTCIALAVLGALAAPPAAAQWRALGLSGRHVNRLRIHEGYLYACTSDGLHRLSLASPDTIWDAVQPACRR